MKQQHTKDKMTRREFIGRAAVTAAAFSVVPSRVIGKDAPSGKLNVAGIGAGGMGKGNIDKCKHENIIALCDVDWKRADETFKKFPDVKKFWDFRVMLEEMGDKIDAVIVATPDHTHATAAMAAMKKGKHVYVQKPLTRTVYEARVLTEAARKYKVKTQMGNQGHSNNGLRLLCEWIWDGAIGDIQEVHAWTNRPIWPQGIDKPKEVMEPPKTLNWDLWLGPSPERAYNPCYAPFKWRGWWDFGSGALGDMACHILDPAVFSLKLKYPVAVEACATEVNEQTFPLASIIRYDFPAREGMPPVRVHWYDGGMLPPRPLQMESEKKFPNSTKSVIFVGSKGILCCGDYGGSPRLIPEAKMQAYIKKGLPPKTIPRIKGNHEQNWLDACKGKVDQACSNFDYAGPFTEFVVMGNLALRHLNQRLEWDGPNMKFTNNDEANKYIKLPYRSGWTL